jgi:protein involved in sex pheromone biosynthesis
MKKTVALIFAVSMLFLAGCCTTHQATKWEYKQQAGRLSDENLNKLADEGWIVVCYGNDTLGNFYILKRHKQ